MILIFPFRSVRRLANTDDIIVLFDFATSTPNLNRLLCYVNTIQRFYYVWTVEWIYTLASRNNRSEHQSINNVNFMGRDAIHYRLLIILYLCVRR